jgi:probable rRNA maturation factor
VTVYLRDTTRRRFDRRGLKRALATLMREAGEGEASIALTFVGDAGMRRINRERRGNDAATDVLSFPLYGPGEATPPGVERLLGDIVISVPTAQRQAIAYDASLNAELKRLLVHGLLHLLGHDHQRPKERARMEAEERRLAATIDLAWPYEHGGRAAVARRG